MGDKRRSCVCVDCGLMFEGWKNSLRCPECVGKRRKENQRRAMERYKERVATGQIKKPEKKPVAKKPNTEQCKGCEHWRFLRNNGELKSSPRGCHYLLDTGKRRERDGDICYSRTPKDSAKENPT